MSADYTFRRGDTEPILDRHLTYSDGSAVNLRGATLSLIARSLSSAAPLTLTGAVTAVSPPESGHVQYRPSTADSAQPAGTYLINWKVVFSDGTPQTFPSDGSMLMEIGESLTDAALTAGIRPSVDEVATLLRARTKVRGGAEIGTFNDVAAPNGTRPKASDVEDLIDEALQDVLGKVTPIDHSVPPGSAYNAPGSDYERRVRGAVRLYSAVLVELSFFPEQVRSGQSAAPTYQSLYDSRVRALISEGETGRPQGMGEGASGAGDAPADAAWGGFPANGGGMISWSSRW